MNSVEKVLDILNERKIPVSRLERDLKFGNGYIKQLRKGTIPTVRLLLIARYLQVPVKDLMPDGEFIDDVFVEPVKGNKKTAAPEGDGQLERNALLIELFESLPLDRQLAVIRQLQEIARLQKAQDALLGL